MNAIRTLIVDDEPLARRGIRVLLDTDPDIVVVGECGDAHDALDLIERLAPELLLVDVQMPETSGLDLVRSIPPSRMPVVVFVTAFDRHAVDAFEVNAIDYVVKPIDEQRFARTLDRAKVQVRRVRLESVARGLGTIPQMQTSARRYLERFSVRAGERTILVAADAVDWIEAVDYHVRLHAGPAKHLLRESLSALAQRLDPADFHRVHRSAIVRLDRVSEIVTEARGRHAIVLRDGTRLPLSRRRRDELEARLADRT